jgi:hypothetical protein
MLFGIVFGFYYLSSLDFIVKRPCLIRSPSLFRVSRFTRVRLYDTILLRGVMPTKPHM